MYSVLFDIKTKAKTFKGINRAIERETGCFDWFDSDEDIEKQIRSGFVKKSSTGIVVFIDCGC